MGLSIRRAGAADAGTISALCRDIQTLHAKALPERFKPAEPDTFPPALVRRLVARPQTVFLLAICDGEPAGYLYAELVRKPETLSSYARASVYVNHIGVGRGFRRRGIGKALLDAIRELGAQAGVTDLTLDVWSFNEGARAFFREYGLISYTERLGTS